MVRDAAAKDLKRQDASGQCENAWRLSAGRRRGGAPGSAAAALTLAASPDVHLVACGAVAGVLTVQVIRVSPPDKSLSLHVRSGLTICREA